MATATSLARDVQATGFGAPGGLQTIQSGALLDLSRTRSEEAQVIFDSYQNQQQMKPG